MRKEKLVVKIYVGKIGGRFWGQAPEVELRVFLGDKFEHIKQKPSYVVYPIEKIAKIADVIMKSKILASLLKAKYIQSQGNAPSALNYENGRITISITTGMSDIDEILNWLGLKKVEEIYKMQYKEYTYEGEITIV